MSVKTDQQANNYFMIPDDQVVSMLAHCQELLYEHLHPLMLRFLTKWQEQLQNHADNARSDVEKRETLDNLKTLQLERSELLRIFAGYLSDNINKFKRKELNTPSVDTFAGQSLSLVAKDSLEQSLAISSINQRAKNLYMGSLIALSGGLSRLSSNMTITEENNPFSPLQFCSVLHKLMNRLDIAPRSVILGYKTFDSQVISSLGAFYEDLVDYLMSHNVIVEQPSKNADALSQLRAANKVGAPPAVVSSQLEAVTRGRELPAEEYQAELFHAIKLLQQHFGPQNQAPVDLAQCYETTEVIQAVASLQSQLGELSEKVTFKDVKLQQELQQKLKETSEKSAIDPRHTHIIDIVGLLFEYMLSDENLPDSVKTLLSHLHTPYLKVAFIDQEFFEEATHPARRLLNQITEVAAGWVRPDGSSDSDVYNKIKAVVTRILHDFEHDIRLFADLLVDFSRFSATLKRRNELVEQRSREKVKGETKLNEVKSSVYEEIQSRIHNKALPSAVVLLMLQPWSDYLAFILLRYGEKSQEWRQSIQVVEDTLWIIKPKALEVDKSRQLSIFNQYLTAIEHGFKTIGYDKTKSQQLIKVLTHLHKLSLQNRSAPPAGPEIREKLEKLAIKKLAVDIDQNMNEDEQKIMDNLQLIELGSWFEFADKERLKLSWCDTRVSKFLFVNQVGKTVYTLSGIELVRKMINSEAKIIVGSTKPFFERALENIYKKLQSKDT